MKYNTVIISDEVGPLLVPRICVLQRKWNCSFNLIQVYDKLTYTSFTRTASLSPSIARLTLTVGSVGKHFYATGWRIGFLIGPEDLVACVRKAHTRICFVSPSILQEAAAVGYEVAEKRDFWRQAIEETAGKMKRFCGVWDELGIPVSYVQKRRRVTSVVRDLLTLSVIKVFGAGWRVFRRC